MPRDWYINESELDDYQIKIINRRADSSLIVKGCAGSGKTIIALWKAKEIQESNRGSFYVIVFTKALRQFIEDGVRNIGIDSSRVLHHWDWRNDRMAPEADYLIVDEVQDFKEEEIFEFKNKAKKAFLFYGDSAQQIYKNLDNSNRLTLEEMTAVTGAPLEVLVFNHRLPKKIARLAEYITSVDDDLEGRCKFEGESLPRIFEYNYYEAQLDRILEIINDEKLTDVGILFPKNRDVEDAYDYFREKKLNCEAKFTSNRNELMTLDFTTDNPKMMTFHSSKGLQFETVFIPNCSFDDYDLDRWQNPLYVAITRAYKDLYIMHSGDLTSLFDDVPVNLYTTNQAQADVDDLF